MKSKDYIKKAIRTESVHYRKLTKGNQRLEHAILGMITESGELADALKKYKFYNLPLDKVNLIEEIGDVLWYVAIACDELGVDFEKIMDKNIRKLEVRYPEKFTSEKSKKRNLKKERKELNK
ncbi:nucleoside triphosphate pyrophosphohydrolase family protein [Candidatus Woesebacteria bacterium]|nr:MAG: nucleoside triphosphate pyrophosphohydrolase family protein [Candidatus Woesebacteria bacterium]